MEQTEKISARNKWSYSIGCIGRDMCYALFSSYLVYFLINAIGVSDWELGVITIIMLIGRIWDAINDPIMGVIVDNTKSRWGKFKPWIILGAVASAGITMLLFTDFGISGVPFLILFAIFYFLFDITFTANDIGYWSMLPSMSTSQKEREKISSLARIFANVGMFLIMGVTPIVINSNIGAIKGFFIIALITSITFILCQLLVIFGVKEKFNPITSRQDKTHFKEILKLIFKNDQLLTIAISILLFNIGYYITTALGIYFFDYDYGDLGDGKAYTVFLVVVAVTQILALAVYPVFSKRLNRKQLFTLSIVLVVLGYIGFMLIGYAFPMNLITLVIIGVILFFGQAFIQLLVLVMLADTIEYGQWKLGKRTESVLFSLNPFITKMASAIQVGVTNLTLIISGISVLANRRSEIEDSFKKGLINAIEKTDQLKNILTDVNDNMLLILRISMIVIPLLCILGCYVIYMTKYKIDTKMYDRIITDLKAGKTKDGYLDNPNSDIENTQNKNNPEK
ncbi:MAG TPA: glycoside-pentoside-hexuronide (GPH):cation symporter [Clostridia bacterium]